MAYSSIVEATGGESPYSWDITDGALPAGLSLNSGTGEISGTPTTVETQTFTVEVTDDDAATDSQELSIAISLAPTTATSVSVDSISYARDGGRSGDKHLPITVALVDNLDNSVAGASVSIDVSRDGRYYGSGTGTTGSDGTVTFQASNAPQGCYITDVTAITTDSGLAFDGSEPNNGSC